MRDVATDKLMRDVATGKLMRAVAIEYGDNCYCFDTGATPKCISVTFADIVLCANETDPLINGIWTLTQKVDFPCWWQYDVVGSALINVSLQNDPQQTYVSAAGESQHTSQMQFSFTSVGVNCDIRDQYNNSRVCPPSQLGGHGGTATIVWGV